MDAQGSVPSPWGGSGRGAAVRMGRRAAPARNTQPCWPGTTQLPAPSLTAAQAGPRKATVSAGLLLEGKARLTGTSLCAPRSAAPGLGLQAASASRLPEREAGDQAEGRGPGLSQAHPAPGPLSPAMLAGAGDPVRGCRPTSCSPRKPRAGSHLTRGPTGPSLAPLRSEQRCACQQRR